MANTADSATVSITSINDSLTFFPNGPMALTISGTWSGTIVLRYSSDGGTTWRLAGTYTSNPSTGSDYIPSSRGAGKRWQVIPTAWTSGTANVELGHI